MRSSFSMMGAVGVLILALSGCGPSNSVMQADENTVEIVAEISAQIRDLQPKADEMCIAQKKAAVFKSSSCFDATCLEEVFQFVCR